MSEKSKAEQIMEIYQALNPEGRQKLVDFIHALKTDPAKAKAMMEEARAWANS